MGDAEATVSFEDDIKPLLCMVAELGRMLHGLIVSLERKLTSSAG